MSVNRRRPPSVLNIGTYWMDREVWPHPRRKRYDHGDCAEAHVPVIDPGEPDCMGCGVFLGYASEVIREMDDGERARLTGFDRFRGDRAHIIPFAVRPSNEPEAYVLLCHSCHKASPDVDDETAMFIWLAGRHRSEVERVAEIRDALAASLTDEDAERFMSREGPGGDARFNRAIDELKPVMHFGEGHWSAGTWVAICQRAASYAHDDPYWTAAREAA